MWVIVLAFLVLAGFMTLIGWGLSRSMRGAIAVGDKVPNFGVTTFDGKPFSSDQYAGKVVRGEFLGFLVQAVRARSARA